MNIKPIIYRDPGSDAGGGASASSSTGAASASSSSPAGSASPAGASPVSNFQSFAEGLASSLRKTSDASLPAGDGKKTEGPASLPEGDAGSDDESKDPATTADPELEAELGDEEEGGEKDNEWSKEELKTIEAMKVDLPFNTENRTVLKSLRETRSQLDRVSASNTNAISRAQSLEAALYAGDAKALQEMGFDLKLDQRTPDVMIKELEDEFTAIKSTMEPVIKELAAQDPDMARLVTKAVQKVLGRYNDRGAAITKEQENQEFEKKILAKAGVKTDSPNNYKAIADKADRNLTALAQEDPKAGEYYKFIEDETKPGGGLHALGINMARAYGTSLESARTMNKMAKGLYFEKNMKTILASQRKNWEKDRTKRAQTERVGGDSGSPSSPASGLSKLSQGMRAYAGHGA